MNFDHDDLQAAYFLAHRFVDPLRAAGRPVNQAIERYCRKVDLAWELSADGHENGCGAEESEPDDLIDTASAARILGISERHVRRIGNDLDGRKCGGVWMFPRKAVDDYAKEGGLGQTGSSRRAAA